MFQRLATLIADDVIEDEKRRWGHVGSDVMAAPRRRSAAGGGDVGLTSREIQQLIDAHNSRRRSVGATNMEMMVGVRDYCCSTRIIKLKLSWMEDR